MTYQIQAGDIGFAHNRGLMGRLIRFGEWLKGKGLKRLWRRLRGEKIPLNELWNHEFIVSKFENGEWWIIQATMEGVIESPLKSVAPGGRYITLAPPIQCDRAKILEFAYSQVGTRYSILSDVAIGIDIVTWNWFPAFMNSYKRTWNCSGLTNEALRYAGWLHQWINVYTVTPQQGFDALKPQ